MTIAVTSPISEAEFKLRLERLLIQLEDKKNEPYADTAEPETHPSIGIGFDLTVNAVRKKVFAAMGIPAGSALEVALMGAISKSKGSKLDSVVQTNLDTAYGQPFVMTDAQITAAFNEIAKPYIQKAQGSGIPFSNELVALTSVAFNGLYGSGLQKALGLTNPDEARAAAWYEIRVAHVWGQNDKRRMAESALFGLYPQGQVVNEEIARAVYRVFSANDFDMIAYDNIYGGLAAAATAELAAAQINNVTAYDLAGSLKQAADVLVGKYGQGQVFAPKDIRVNGTAGGQSSGVINKDNPNLLIGDTGVDMLVGGNAKDVLVGGDGNDQLTGGKGDDVLVGGKGNDTYVYHLGDGKDTIIEERDADGKIHGRVLIDDGTSLDLAAGIYQREGQQNIWKSSDGLITLSHNSPWTLTLSDGSAIQLGEAQDDFQSGDFGIRLYEETPAPTTTRSILGDLQPLDFDPNTAGVQTQTDDLGNLKVGTVAAPGRVDYLQDSAGNDLIQGLGGNDSIVSWRGGDDRIEGGDGDDWMLGGMGNDLVIGGAGRDVLVEGGGNDTLYADGIVTVTAAIAAENATPSGLPGEALSGGSGDDLAIGGTGNDVVFGGTGDDILIGGAGDDNIDGDSMADTIMPDWSAVRSVITNANGGTTYYTAYNQFSMYWPTDGGADAIYAGAGADWVNAGNGNDYVDGGNDNDVIWGDAGNDDLFGGSGADLILGDEGGNPAVAGDDYLDGEDGDDTLWGEGGNDQLFGGIGADGLYGDTGDDYLDGEDGADILSGGEGADTLFGGNGNDQLWAGNGDDSLDGGANDDLLIGGAGKDELSGGDGADQIAGDNGGTDSSGDADTIYGGAGNDIIDGQGGDDIIDAGADNDLVAGGLGDDLIMGGSGNDQLQGGEGNDILDGGADNDVLYGQAGDDSLNGGGGNDYLFGGTGNDLLDGGNGDDVYVYSYGGGNDRIVDSGGTDWLVFNDIVWGQITLGVGSLKLIVPGGEIHLDDFDPDNPYAAGGIEYFQFADGTVMSKNQLIDALGIAPIGTPEADVLSGTALSETISALAGDDIVTARAGNDTVYAGDGNDVVYAGDGNDVVYGGNGDDVLLGEAGDDTLLGEAGNDLLSGGAGSDQLLGGDGDDTYLFQSGDGQDTATDALGTNSVVLGAGLTLDAIVFSRQGNDLAVAIKDTTDRLTVKDWFAADSHFTGLTLGDGSTLDHAGVDNAMPKNQAPLASPDSATVIEDSVINVVGNALANDSDPEGRALRVTNPGNYAGAVGTLTLDGNGAYTYSLANNTSAVQSLAAGQGLTETFAYTVTDDDPDGAATAESSIRITVQGTNDLPVLGADNAATAEDAGPIGGNVLANDHDVDAGTVLAVANPGTRTGTYGSLTLGSDGSWGYSLANTSTAVQSLAAGQTVTDNFAFNVGDGVAQVGGSLSVSIAGRNDAPIVASTLADQSVAANTSWSWTLPVGSFTDVDAGDVLGYGATLADGSALPSWLAFDATTQTFSGRAPKSATGSIDIRVAATDRAGASAADVFTLSFAAGGGGGGGGNGNGSQGNEGVGNGVDGPPPGHDTSFNDGAGTSPGQPGAQGGNGYRPPNLADVVMTEVRIDGALVEATAPGKDRGNSAAAHAAAPGQIAQADPVTLGTTDTKGKDAATSATTDSPAQARPQVANWLQEAAWAYLDTRGTDASYQAGNESNTVAAFARWLAVEQALARDAANAGTLPAWLNNAKGADLRGLLLTDGRFLGSTQTLGSDPLSLLAGDTLKTFTGLGNGVQKLG